MFWNKHNKLEEEALKNYASITNTLSVLTKEPYSLFNFLIKQQLEVELSDSTLLLKQYEILNNHLVLPIHNQVGYALPVYKLGDVLTHMTILNVSHNVGKECPTVYEFCKTVFARKIDSYWSVPGLTEEIFVNLLVDRYANETSDIDNSEVLDNGIYGHYYQPYIKGEYHEFTRYNYKC